MQDNATGHFAHYFKEWFKIMKMIVQTWPALSANTNLIENM